MRRLSNRCLVSSLKLSVTGDTAKYLVLTLCRGCTNLPTWPSLLFFHDAHFAQMDRCWLGRDFSEVIPQTFLYGPVPTYIPYIICHVGSGFSQHTLSSQSPYSMWLYGKLMSKVVYYLFVPGWPSTSAIHTAVHRHDPGVTTQHKPSKSHFHPGSSLNLVVFP